MGDFRFLVVDNFDFPRKIVKLNFGQKFDCKGSLVLLIEALLFKYRFGVGRWRQ